VTPIATLRSLGACEASIDWALAQCDRSPQALWSACPRGDWLAWYLGRLGARDGHGSPAHRRAVLVACLCARTASRHWRSPASRHWRSPACERAVSLAERWAWGDETVTRDDLRDAYAAADAAAARAAAYAAANAAANAAAADAAAYAADAAANAATNAADAAANAAYAATNAAYNAAVAARAAHLASLADLIRAAVPEVPL